MHKYLHLPHSVDCGCSVCWSKVAMVSVVSSPSTRCELCRPASARPIRPLKMGRVGGVWKVLLSEWEVTPAFTCEKHSPPLRPPKYWHVVYDTGKPTPYVPRYDLFELES
jgi:hypothetical protein